MNGFRFNGKHINEEFPKLKIVSRSTPPPEEIPIKDSVIGKQGDYDFAIAVFGERIFENRPLTYVFTGKEIDDDKRAFDKTMLENWLLKGSYLPLYDDKYPSYYFMARCVGVELESDDGVAKTHYTITFDAYPFKIKKSVEGSPFWDDYDISDYYQETSFHIERTTFKSMLVGQIATVGAWSTQFDGFEKINKQLLGKSYQISDIRTTDQGSSSVAYYLEGLNKWVIEQDVVEAQNGAINIDLYNSGTGSVSPKITISAPVTIIRGNEVYNLFSGVTDSDLFRLFSGHNHLLIASGTRADIKFEFYKEVI